MPFPQRAGRQRVHRQIQAVDNPAHRRISNKGGGDEKGETAKISQGKGMDLEFRSELLSLERRIHIRQAADRSSTLLLAT